MTQTNIFTEQEIVQRLEKAKDAVNKIDGWTMELTYGDSGCPITWSNRFGPNGEFIKDDTTSFHDRMNVGVLAFMGVLATTGYLTYAFNAVTDPARFDMATHFGANTVLLLPTVVATVFTVAAIGKRMAVHKAKRAVQKLAETGFFAKDTVASQSHRGEINRPKSLLK